MPECRIALGLGCDRHTPLDTLQQAIAQALAQSGHTLAQVATVASITLKADEPAMLQLAALQAWPIRFFTPQQLAVIEVPNPSDTVRKYTGTPSVSEAAALLAGRVPMSALLVEKHKHRGPDGKNATVSIARAAASFSAAQFPTHPPDVS